jgi:hypothetical protein
MPNFNQKLNKSFKVVPLTSTDKRLTADSKMIPIKSRLQVSKIKGGIHEAAPMPGAGPKLTPEAPAPKTTPGATPEDISDLGSKLDAMDNGGDLGGDLEGDLGGETEGLDLDTEIPMDGNENSENKKGGATPAGSDYSIEQAHQQLDGVIGNWMDMAGKYPEGEDRHKFLEIGERLREIAGVIKRDYIESATDKAPEDTMEPEEEPALGDELSGLEGNAENLGQETPEMPEKLPEEDLKLNG